MLRTLLTATALTTTLTMGALAQDAQTDVDANAETQGQVEVETEAPAEGQTDSGTMGSETGSDMSAEEEMPAEGEMEQDSMGADSEAGAGQSAGVTLESGYVQAEGDILGTELMGKTVYNGSGDEAEALGDINDTVVSADGDIVAVIIGVGGFLGIGEKGVAAGFEELEITTDANGENRLILNTTVEALEAAPAFEWNDGSEAPMPAGDGAMEGEGSMQSEDGGMDAEAGADAEGEMETDSNS